MRILEEMQIPFGGAQMMYSTSTLKVESELYNCKVCIFK